MTLLSIYLSLSLSLSLSPSLSSSLPLSLSHTHIHVFSYAQDTQWPWHLAAQCGCKYSLNGGYAYLSQSYLQWIAFKYLLLSDIYGTTVTFPMTRLSLQINNLICYLTYNIQQLFNIYC